MQARLELKTDTNSVVSDVPCIQQAATIETAASLLCAGLRMMWGPILNQWSQKDPQSLRSARPWS